MKQALAWGERNLSRHSIESARLEAEILLRHLLGIDRAELYANLDRDLTPEQSSAYATLIARRSNCEPSAYIVGHKEFFGIDFDVSPHVLIPRPETELLVETALQAARRLSGSHVLIADIGTGSGAIAISLALNLPQARTYAVDISLEALAVAQRNCMRYNVGERVTLLHGDLLDPLPEPVHLIVANLPYINESDMRQLPPEVRGFEPQVALAGGRDGLDTIGRLLLQARAGLLPGGVLLAEIGFDQGRRASEMAAAVFPCARRSMIRDLGDRDRVLSIETGVE